MQKLLDYLSSIPTGPVQDRDELEIRLSSCWDDFRYSGDESMTGSKLRSRMENVVWAQPILSFVIERHGVYVIGSTRAELHEWTVNIETKVAGCRKIGHRQLDPMQPRLNVAPIAEEFALAIVDHQSDERLKWNKDGSVRVAIGKIVPAGSAVKQTLEGRRKRLRQAIEANLVKAVGTRFEQTCMLHLIPTPSLTYWFRAMMRGRWRICTRLSPLTWFSPFEYRVT